jgi:hypothetical protein
MNKPDFKRPNSAKPKLFLQVLIDGMMVLIAVLIAIS